jgi:hypothetical protein
VTLKFGAGGDQAYLCVFDDAAPKVFDRGLEHGAAEVVSMNVETGKRL